MSGRVASAKQSGIARAMLMGSCLLSCAAPGLSQAGAPEAASSAAPRVASAATPATPAAAGGFVHRSRAMSDHARDHYQLLYGVDSLDVKAVESGLMIRFSYTVLDPAKAAQLNDKKNNPLLIDEQTHVKLDVPTMEKVGQLRQSSTPEAGKQYWMVFSNKGRAVKPGDRVDIVIGKFRAEGLYVR